MPALRRGNQDMNYIYHYHSPMGPLTLESDGQCLVGIHLPGSAPPTDASAKQAASSDLFAAAVSQLDAYFAGKRTTFELKLAPRGTAFQMRVWELLKAIPHGETISYGELARRAGNPAAARAVGAANGRNPLPIVIPCHRVIGADGKMIGYGGGLSIKRALLRLEGSL